MRLGQTFHMSPLAIADLTKWQYDILTSEHNKMVNAMAKRQEATKHKSAH